MTIQKTTVDGIDFYTESTSTTGSVDIEIDYTAFYDRIADALETIATNSTTIKDDLALIKASLSTIATDTTSISGSASTVSTNVATMTGNTTSIKDDIASLEERGRTKGIKIISPWEWIGIASIVKIFDEKKEDYKKMKARVEQLETHD